MATNTQEGTQTGQGTILNKTGLADDDIEITQKFVDSRRARQTKYTIFSSVDGTFTIEKLMRGSGTWVEIKTGVTHTGHASDPSHYIIDEFPAGVSRVSFTIDDGTAGGSSTLEIHATSIPR